MAAPSGCGLAVSVYVTVVPSVRVKGVKQLCAQFHNASACCQTVSPLFGLKSAFHSCPLGTGSRDVGSVTDLQILKI